MNKYLFLFLLIPVLLPSQEVWNSMPFISFPNAQITDMLIDNDKVIVYGDAFNNIVELKQGLLIAKLDTNGITIKEKFILDSLGDKLAVSEKWGKIIKTSDNGYIATAASVNCKGALLIKLDNDLNVVFIKEYSDTSLISNFWYIPREVKNGYLLFGNQQLIDLKVVGFVKYIDYQGNMIWEKQFSFVPEDTYISDLQLLSDTSFVFVTTETIDPGTISQLGSIRSGIYKINFTGDITASWQSETTPPTGGLLRVIPLAGGDVMTYGVTRKSVTPFGSELLQPTMTRFDTNFNVVWTYSFGRITSSGGNHLQKFSKTNEGNYVGVGQFGTKVGTDVTRGHGWIYKFSAQGDSIWGRTFPTPLLPDEYPNGGILYGLGILSSGNIVAGGTANDANNKYCWLVKITNDGCMDTLFCQTSALFSPTENATNVLMYPNPTSGYTSIESPIEIERITLFDLSNKKIREYNKKGKNIEILLPSSLSNGVYIVCLQTENGKSIYKKLFVLK